MREVIQGLLGAEGEARRLVQSAREEATRLVADAEKRAQALVVPARQRVHTEAAQLIETAIETAQQEKQKQLEAAKKHISSEVCLDEGTRNRIVEAVVRCISAQP